LTSLLQDEYPYHSMVPGNDPFGPVTDGGVIILSKWPIEAQSAIVYSVCSGTLNINAPDCFAQKGVVWARIVKDGHRINVFGTHMDAGDEDGDFAARDVQMQEFARFILNRVPIDEPAIMAGDYNINKQGDGRMKYQYF